MRTDDPTGAQGFVPDPYRPLNRRRRLLIVLLAIVTAAFVTWAMTRRWGIVREAAKHPQDVPACTAGEATGCVGSMTAVIPAAPASPASR